MVLGEDRVGSSLARKIDVPYHLHDLHVLNYLSVFFMSHFISQELGPDMKKDPKDMCLQTSFYTLHP